MTMLERKHQVINFQWTAIMTSFMLTSLIEQANLGLKSDKGFKSVAIARAVSERFNLAVSDSHVFNHLRYVRKFWLIIKKIKNLSGVSWDDVEKKIIMGEEEYQIYIQAHPREEIYINRPIQDYKKMAIVCGNDQATGSFARSGTQSSGSLGAQMEPPPTSPVINLDNQTQGFDSFDDIAPTQPPNNDTPTSSTCMAREEADKSLFIGKQLFDEIMTLIDHYTEYDFGWTYDYLLQNLPLANGFMNKTHSLRYFG
ncbi:SH2 domain-containing protein [Dioscorea alata]|uniref:SH2 domain-containing protein n=1 Tax=Dioscorea alata TaxID=55571 RepID=A0ACB7VP19_DIOAL|nr:SH2 domain-containing protein [Dioscorea alata]